MDAAPRHWRVETMGTVVTFDLFGVEEGADDEVLAAFARAEDALKRADAVFSTWIAESPLSRLRRGEIPLSAAPPEVAEVLGACARAREATGGWFNPWAMPGGVDPSGYVKGWAGERALEALATVPAEAAMVNAAGDVCARGTLAGAALRVGVADPRDPTGLIAVVELEAALATSGDYERPGHLIDPHTRLSRTSFASASVTGPDLALADAWATALCVGGEEVFDLVRRSADYEAFVVTHDGDVRASEGFPLAH